MFFLFFSADRCVGSAATVAGLTFWSSVEAENRDSGQTGARLLSWNLGYFYNESKLKNLVYVLLCRWGLWNTAIVVGPAIQLSPIAIELHRSRHSHDILRGNFSCCADKAWSSALLCGLDAHDVSKMTLVFNGPHIAGLLRWVQTSSILKNTDRAALVILLLECFMSSNDFRK